MTHLQRLRAIAWPTLCAAALSGAGTASRADTVSAPPLPAYQQECGACHLAYPPGLLPAASWQRLMSQLPRHFGTDASLDAATLNALMPYLAAHAGSYRKLARDPAPPPEDRITRSTWFVHEHDEVDAAVWRRPAVGSPSHCAACHRGAAQGRFDEHDIHIPR